MTRKLLQTLHILAAFPLVWTWDLAHAIRDGIRRSSRATVPFLIRIIRDVWSPPPGPSFAPTPTPVLRARHPEERTDA